MAAPMNVLVVNSGSSSLKLRLVGAHDRLLDARDSGAAPEEFGGEIADFVRDQGAVHAVGHRVVHGGDHFVGPVQVDGDVADRIRGLAPLAPQHQPAALAGIAAGRAALPEVPAVACFDTSFHATMPPLATTYPVPESWRQQWGVRRYGFHGLSHAYVARRSAQMLDHVPGDLRVISCHLGGGVSLCAVAEQRSVDTTMGMTPLEGPMMTRRSGTVDPGMLLWLIERGHLSAGAAARDLQEASGLAGVAGGSGDIREVVAARSEGHRRAVLAFDMYVHRLAREIGGMAAALGRVDALVFTGGIGEHAPEVRSAVTDRLGFLGADLDGAANAAADGADADISAPGAATTTLVIQAREELVIAQQTREVLG